MFRFIKQHKKMSGLDNMRMRMSYAGGDADGRNVKGKLTSFHSALRDSYQAEWITLNGNKCRCLINPDKLKEDYDQKIISIDFDSNIKEGDTFLWNRTNTYWITYLQEFAEEAYFRAEIRRCNYQIEIEGTKYWVYLRGPVETALAWKEKHNIAFNDLNYSLILYITKNEQTLNYFNRTKIIKFDGHNWQVEATDKYSQKNIIEVNLGEYFDNPMKDAQIIPEIVEPDKTQPYIDGPRTLEPYQENVSYSTVGLENALNGTFVVNSTKVQIEEMDNSSCILNILSGKAISFDLTYNYQTSIEDEIMPIEDEIPPLVDHSITITINVESF